MTEPVPEHNSQVVLSSELTEGGASDFAAEISHRDCVKHRKGHLKENSECRYAAAEEVTSCESLGDKFSPIIIPPIVA